MPDPQPLRVVIVSGGRNFTGSEAAERVWVTWLAVAQPDEVWHGDCRGADRWASTIAEERGVRVRAFPADWNRYGWSASPRRSNKEMAVEAALLKEQGAVVSWVFFPGGTANAKKCATDAGITVFDLEDGGES